jgi:hypothetical protein
MADVERGGQGSRIRPVVVEAPVLVPTLSEADQAVAVSALTVILAAWWAEQQATDGGEPDA